MLRHRVRRRVSVKELGVPSNMLQMALTWTKDSVALSEHRFIKDLGEEHNLLGCKNVHTPMDKGISLVPAKVCNE